MNINTHKQTPPPSNRALDSLPREEQKPNPETDGVFTIDDVICPFLRTGVNEGALITDADGNATNLPEFLKEFAGASWALRGIANHAAKKLTVDGNWAALKADSFNLQDLAGSTLDHKADTQILRGGFNQERLDRALTYSSDGERLTLADMRRFQKDNVKEEPGKRDEFIGAAEFALIVKVFGRTDAMGDRFIRNQDFVSLFKDNKWPEGWEKPEPGSLGLWSTGVAIKEYFASGEEASEVSDVSEMAGSQETKKGAAACPFLSGQPYDVGEAAKHHNDKLE
jgi:hypothetical protein